MSRVLVCSNDRRSRKEMKLGLGGSLGNGIDTISGPISAALTGYPVIIVDLCPLSQEIAFIEKAKTTENDVVALSWREDDEEDLLSAGADFFYCKGDGLRGLTSLVSNILSK